MLEPRLLKKWLMIFSVYHLKENLFHFLFAIKKMKNKSLINKLRILMLEARLLKKWLMIFSVVIYCLVTLYILRPEEEVSQFRNLQLLGDEFYTTQQPNFKRFIYPHKNKKYYGRTFQIVTYIERNSNTLYNGFQNFIYSLIMLGYGEPIVITEEYNTETETKEYLRWIKRTEDYLRVSKLFDSDAILLFTDATDILFISGPDELTSRYMKRYSQPVLCAESLCDTKYCRADKGSRMFQESMAPDHSTHKYLNGGMLIGEAGKLTELFSKALTIMKDLQIDDQAAYVKLWANSPNLITLDYGSEICGIVSPNIVEFYNDFSISKAVSKGLGYSLIDDSKYGQYIIESKNSKVQPVALHFAGMRYTTADSQYNACQVHQLHLYNSLLSASQGSMATSSERKRVVISLTTTPGRINGLLPTLKSLQEQTFQADKIYINVPYYSDRFQQFYDIPSELQGIPGVEILRGDDYGPATKLIYTLKKETDSKTLIINVDDEYIYPDNLVEILVQSFVKFPYAAFSFAGQMIDNAQTNFRKYSYRVRSACNPTDPQWMDHATQIDIIEAFMGTIYERSFFDLKSLEPIDDICRTTDDIWISAHLAEKNIMRIKLPLPNSFKHGFIEAGNDHIKPLRDNNFNLQLNNKCATRLINKFQPPTERPDIIAVDYSPLSINSHDSIDYRFFFEYERAKLNNFYGPCNPATLKDIKQGTTEDQEIWFKILFIGRKIEKKLPRKIQLVRGTDK